MPSPSKSFAGFVWVTRGGGGDLPGRLSTQLMSRILAMAGIAVIALIHVLDAPDTYASTRYLFWLYVVLIAGGIPLIALLLRTRSQRVWLATLGYAAGPFVGYVVSRSIGLPGDGGDVGDWLNSLGLASLVVEGVLIVLSVTQLRLPSDSPSRLGDSPAHSAQTLTVVDKSSGHDALGTTAA